MPSIIDRRQSVVVEERLLPSYLGFVHRIHLSHPCTGKLTTAGNLNADRILSPSLKLHIETGWGFKNAAQLILQKMLPLTK